MKTNLARKSLLLLALLGLLTAFTFTACQSSDNHEHPAGEHPKK